MDLWQLQKEVENTDLSQGRLGASKPKTAIFPVNFLAFPEQLLVFGCILLMRCYAPFPNFRAHWFKMLYICSE